jgi:hypothetical protein
VAGHHDAELQAHTFHGASPCAHRSLSCTASL